MKGAIMNNNNKKDNRKTLVSVMATRPIWALIGFVIGNTWNDISGGIGGVIGLAVGYIFGIFFRKWIYKKE